MVLRRLKEALIMLRTLSDYRGYYIKVLMKHGLKERSSRMWTAGSLNSKVQHRVFNRLFSILYSDKIYIRKGYGYKEFNAVVVSNKSARHIVKVVLNSVNNSKYSYTRRMRRLLSINRSMFDGYYKRYIRDISKLKSTLLIVNKSSNNRVKILPWGAPRVLRKYVKSLSKSYSKQYSNIHRNSNRRIKGCMRHNIRSKAIGRVLRNSV